MRQTSPIPSMFGFSRRLPEIYLVISLLLGGFYALVTPPFWVYDEAAHALRGVQITRGVLLARPNVAGKGEWLDSGMVAVTFGYYALLSHDLRLQQSSRPVPRITASQVEVARATRWSGVPAFATFPMTRIYPPTFYIPGAIAWKIAQARDYTIVHSLLLVCVCNVLVASALGWLAVRLAKACRLTLATMLLLPAVLSIDGSASQDAVLVAFAALGVALLSRPLAEARLPLLWELAGAGFALALCGMARPPYAVLLLTLLLPAMDLKRYDNQALLPPSVAMLVGVAAVGLWSAAVKPLGVIIGPNANPAAQTAFLVHQPIRAGLHLLTGFLRSMPFLISGVTATASGNVRPSHSFAGLTIALVAVIALGEPVALLRRASIRLLALGLFAVVAFSIALAEYIIWTTPGASVLEGMQLRHLFPLLLFLTLLGGTFVSVRLWWRQLAFVSFLIVNCCVLAIDCKLLSGMDLLSEIRFMLS